ncbi:MAG: 1-acyl-sn-glycerol-3-phosphate acyltransferase [Phycisphaera sp.]|nr:1-acyl-sn-glycerol-3-phosphate acyltransferase [Phycisphaera sp.]
MTALFQASRRAPGRPNIAVMWWDAWRALVQWIIHLGFGLRVTGRERVPRTGPLLYLSNHQSFLDPVINGAAVKDRPFRPFARETLFRGPFGWLIRTLGALPVAGKGGDKSVMRAALAELAEGRCVLVYPEGTRTEDGALRPFKSGIAILLRRSEATIVPMGIEGAFEAWPRQRSSPRWRRAIEVEVGEPIDRDELLADGVPAAMLRLESCIDELRRRCRARLRERFGPEYPSAGPGDGVTPVRGESETAPEEDAEG